MDVHKKIKALRNSKKLTQQSFADAVKISRSSLAQIELGKSKPTYDIMNNIVLAFGIDANYFFSQEEGLNTKSENTESVENVINNNNFDKIDSFNLIAKHNIIKHALSKISGYSRMEEIENAVLNTSNYLFYYHSQFLEKMINDVSHNAPYIKDFKEFTKKNTKEIEGFKNIIDTYDKAIQVLEKANEEFEKKHDFLNMYGIPE